MSRNHSIDYFKGLLVIGMVYAHVLQFFSDETIFPSVYVSSQFLNLITFSGFVFCFGYVCQLAYYSKPFTKVYGRMFITGIKTLAAFYISGLAFRVFVSNQQLSLDTIMPIVLLKDIPGWSEFLVSFALIILLGLALFHGFVWISKRPVIFWGITLLLLAATLIDYSQFHSTYMGLLVGTAHFPTFPVLQYMPFYLLGIYFAKYRIGFDWKYLVISMFGTILFIYYLITHDFQLPSRFPPSIYWIAGSTFFLYVYYVFSMLLEKWGKGLALLQIMGANALFYLLISNLFIFSLDNALNLFIVGPWKGLFFTISLLLVITFFIHIMTPRTKKRKTVIASEGQHKASA